MSESTASLKCGCGGQEYSLDYQLKNMILPYGTISPSNINEPKLKLGQCVEIAER